MDSSKTLGIHWHVSTDQFHIVVPTVKVNTSATKRNLASVAAKIFDVLGLFSPVIVRIKVLLQRMWKLGLD